MATITNAHIVSTLNIFEKIKKSDRTLPIKVSYAINKNISTLLPIYKAYEETLKGVDVDSDKDSLITLLNTENEVDLYCLTLDELEGADLSINEMEIIQTYMLKDE